MILLLFIILVIILLFISIDTPSRRTRRHKKHDLDCTNKPFILDNKCVASCPSYIDENNTDCINYIPEGKYLLGNNIVSSCPMYYTNTRVCGYPKAEFISSAISKDGVYKTLVTGDGIVVSFNGLEWAVYNHSNIFNNVVKLLMNGSGNKQLIMTLNSVYLSTDYGKTWSLLLTEETKVIDVDMHTDGKIILIVDRSSSGSYVNNVENYNEDGTTTVVKSFENILITQISIGKYESVNYTDYFAVLRTEGNNIVQQYPSQDNQCFIIKSINATSPQINNTFLINFYYNFDEIRTKPYETEIITHIEMSKDARLIYVITMENRPFGRTFFYTGVVLGPQPNSIVNLYRSNIDIGNLVYMKSSYHGLNNLGIIHNDSTNTEYMINFDVVYSEQILEGNPLLVSSRLNSTIKGNYTTVSVSRDENIENDGKYKNSCLNVGEIYESKNYGNIFERMK